MSLSARWTRSAGRQSGRPKANPETGPVDVVRRNSDEHRFRIFGPFCFVRNDVQRSLVTLILIGLVLLADSVFPSHGAWAQLAHHPFAVGASEGAVGHQSGFGAWLLGMESGFYLKLTGAVRAASTSTAGALTLIGLSFAYGIFHAAGPGHGKAVITSYMVSNEVALRRGLLISLAAALLQGLIATAIVGIAAILFNATAARMTQASQMIELASYLGIVALGLLLVWRKGRALWAAIRPAPARSALMMAGAGPAYSFSDVDFLGGAAMSRSSRFAADDGSHLHDDDCGCGHAHMPDPTTLMAKRFDWKAAALAVVTAGARPCSGAILVLVFSLAQGLFLAGIAATFAMALGTAITTGLLAITAVFAKDLAMRLSGTGSPRAVLAGRLVEFGGAACVLLFGIALLAASLAGVHGGA